MFLKPKTVTDHVPVFNEVITDLINNWQRNAAENNGTLDNLEKELYNWSIECKYFSHNR